MRIGSQSVSRWRLWVKLDGNTSTSSVAKARNINPGRQSRNSRVSCDPAPMAIASARFSTIASDLVCSVMVPADSVSFLHELPRRMDTTVGVLFYKNGVSIVNNFFCHLFCYVGN